MYIATFDAMTRNYRKRRRLGSRFEQLESRLMLHGAGPEPHDHPPDYDPTSDYHIHAELAIWVNGSKVTIPAGVGDTVGIHTHDDTGRLHLHPNLTNPGSRTEFITLGDFFEIWRTDPDAEDQNTNAVLSQSQLLNNFVDTSHSLQMIVNGIRTEQFHNYPIHDGDRILLIYGANPIVTFETNVGPIVMELFANPTTDPSLLRAGQSAPVDTSSTVENFLGYVNRGEYQNMFFHRLQTDFVIQGGGYITATGDVADTDQISAVAQGPTIINEPGLSNRRGTIAMARGSAVNSATSEFYFNLNDTNTFLDTQNQGFTVFGRVLDLATVDVIAQLQTQSIASTNLFEARLSGTSEVPAVTTTAAGSAALFFRPVPGTFDLDIFIAGITAAELTASHIHSGASGVNGPQIFDLGDGSQWVEDRGGLRRTLSGATFPAANMNDLINGNTYLNVHTTDHPNGEIRGQLFRRTFADASIGFPPVTPNPHFVFVQSITGLGTIRGTVFHDANNNGSRDTNEVGIAGVTVYIDANNSGGLDVGERSTTTAIDGSYFLHVPAGTYTVRQITPTNFLQTSPLNPSHHTVTVEIGDAETNVNFGNDAEFDNFLSGFVYADVNNDGLRNPGEVGLRGVTVTLSGTDASNNAVNQVQVTAGDGSYKFINLPPGQYTIVQTQPQHRVDGRETIGTQGGDVSVNDQFTIQVAPGTQGTDNNFGERGLTAPYVRLSDFFTTREELPNFARRFDNTILAATNSTTGQLWSSLGAGWAGFRSAEVLVSQNATSVTLNVVNTNQTRLTTTIAMTDPRVDLLGRNGDVFVIRLRGNSTAFNLTPA